MSGLNWDKATRRDTSYGLHRAEREGKNDERRRDRSSLRPTEKQLRYIAHLAKRLGVDSPGCETRDGAAALINELKRRLG